MDNSLDMKEEILAALREQQLYYRDIMDMFNLSHKEMRNYLICMKRLELIDTYEPDSHKCSNKRRWYKTMRTETYSEMLRARKEKHLDNCKNQFSEKKPSSPHIRLIELTDKKHTTGNRARINAWSGYQGMADVF